MSDFVHIAQDLEESGVLKIQDGNHGEYRPRSNEFTDTGTAFIRAADIQSGQILFGTAQKVNEYAVQRIRKGVGQPLDSILSHKGTVGKVGFAKKNAPPFVCSPQTTFWRSLDHQQIHPKYLFYYLQSKAFVQQIRAIEHESDMAAYVSLTQQRRLKVTLPPIHIQTAIADMLGALDDKIAVNERIATKTRDLSMALLVQAIQTDGPHEYDVASISSVLTRGIAPKYSESDDQLTVLNQKCVRDGRVNLTAARKTLREKVKSPKLLQKNDVVVNSTGVGTLGRVALWTFETDATVDSHVTIVRFDPGRVDPVCAGFAMLRAQPEIEAMGEGSTGQTELRRTQLSDLRLALPSPKQQRLLRSKLDSLEQRSLQALNENDALAALRDALLPQLMSGRIQVRDAERIVEDST